MWVTPLVSQPEPLPAPTWVTPPFELRRGYPKFSRHGSRGAHNPALLAGLPAGPQDAKLAGLQTVTIPGIDVAGLRGGGLFIENAFALPGIGTLAVQSVFNLDPPVVMGTVMFSATLVVGANWVVDLL